ncbi:fimbrial assembly protein [Salmonella enterica subsp. enterica serovar Gallinarum str. 9184]|nr:fimbrial assembly protein [Salmonella enterica subsp. enterica serovar Gallinarum str. 9184]SUI10964.1 fimbrial protein [Salmonella enterica subsp. enterica serovar Gallinarum]
MRRLYLALILLLAYSGHSYASCKRSGNEGAITITPPSQLVAIGLGFHLRSHNGWL